MHLKSQQKLWLRADESSPWLPLSAGLYRVGSGVKAAKRRWFGLGQEAAPLEEYLESVKEITLHFRFCESDAAQQLLLGSGGSQLLLKRELVSKNGESIVFSSLCAVSPAEEIEGSADEPLSYRVKLSISQENPETVKA